LVFLLLTRQLKIKPPLEASIQKSILDYLLMRGYFVWRNNTGGFGGDSNAGKKWFVRAGLKGSGDIIGMTKTGKFLSIEVKRRGNKPSAEQVHFMDRVKSMDGCAFVAYDIQDVINQGF